MVFLELCNHQPSALRQAAAENDAVLALENVGVPLTQDLAKHGLDQVTFSPKAGEALGEEM